MKDAAYYRAWYAKNKERLKPIKAAASRRAYHRKRKLTDATILERIAAASRKKRGM